MATQPDAIGARALHSDPVNGPEAGQPARQRRVPGPSSRERLDAQDTAIGVQCRSSMGVQVRIDAPRHRVRALYDGHCHPFLSQRFKGWHARPGNETVASLLLAQLARSPSRTGRASFQHGGPADKHLNQLGTTTSQTRPREPVNVATTNHKLVDPSPASAVSLAAMCGHSPQIASMGIPAATAMVTPTTSTEHIPTRRWWSWRVPGTCRTWSGIPSSTARPDVYSTQSGDPPSSLVRRGCEHRAPSASLSRPSSM